MLFALDLHSVCTKIGAKQIESLESIAPLQDVLDMPENCPAMALLTIDRRTVSNKRNTKAFSVKAIDWFPHINQNGYPTVVFWWIRTCLRCGDQVARTGTSSQTNLPVGPCHCEAS